jgi:hypothetical protein
LDFDTRKFAAWRKIIFVGGLGTTFLLGFAVFWMRMDVFAAAPRHPDFATRQVLPVRTQYGYTIYLSSQEKKKLDLWAPWIGIPLIPTLLVVITSREFWESVRAL